MLTDFFWVESHGLCSGIYDCLSRPCMRYIGHVLFVMADEQMAACKK